VKIQGHGEPHPGVCGSLRFGRAEGFCLPTPISWFLVKSESIGNSVRVKRIQSCSKNQRFFVDLQNYHSGE